MTVPYTLALGGLCLVLTLFCGWRGARTSRPLVSPRLVPWRFLMLTTFAGLIAALAHLVNLLRAPAGAA